MRNSNVERVGEDFFVLRGAGAVVQFTNNKGADINFSTTSTLKQGDLRIVPWGANNLQPQDMLKLVFGNHIKPQLLLTSRDFLLGAGLGVFKRNAVGGKIVMEPVIDLEMEGWLDEMDAPFVLNSTAFNLEYFGNYFTNIVLNSSKKVEDMVPFDCTMVRAQETLQRKPERYYLHPDWANFKAADVVTRPAYDRKNPTKYGDFLYHGRDWTPGQKYYDSPAYWGTRKWTEVSNKIPTFHSKGLDNGYNLTYHIKIPRDYFLQFGDKKAQEAAEDEILNSMDDLLSGVENAGKVFVSKFGVDNAGKPIPGWSIEPIENKMSDTAYESVNSQANIAHTSGHGIDPSLAGIDTGSKLGGSGSEKRISYQLHIALRTPTKRKILLEQFNVARKLMGFNPEHQYGFNDIEITTLAEDPKGQKAPKNMAN
jgi:hypothetical protein